MAAGALSLFRYAAKDVTVESPSLRRRPPRGPAEGRGSISSSQPASAGGSIPEDVGVYIGRPVYTSSAYEFFDFILGYLSSFDCLIEFTGNAWCIRVVNPVRE